MSRPSPYQAARRVEKTKPYEFPKSMSAADLVSHGLVKKGFGNSDNNTKNEASGTETSGAYGLGYDVGDKVRHIKFGTGTVLSIRDGGRDYEVTVDFQNAGVKKMFASFAKLKKTD